MTDREVMQQALDALLGYKPNSLTHAKEQGSAIIALREAIAQPKDKPSKYGSPELQTMILNKFAQPVQPGLAERIQREIDHCVMNDLRLVPYFGKLKGDRAVRVASLEAILKTFEQPESTK